MTGPLDVDTSQMLLTAQKSTNVADNILGHARLLRSGIDFVMGAWQGQTGDAFRASMGQQRPVLDQLILKLQAAAESVKHGSEGFSSHDSGGRAKTAAAGQQFLSGPLNG